jgi:hypothetical protein
LGAFAAIQCKTCSFPKFSQAFGLQLAFSRNVFASLYRAIDFLFLGIEEMPNGWFFAHWVNLLKNPFQKK